MFIIKSTKTDAILGNDGPMITDETIIAIHEDDGSEIWPETTRCTWAEFKDANDAMDQDDFSEIRAALNHTGFYSGGGGAFARYELRMIDEPGGAPMTRCTDHGHGLALHLEDRAGAQRSIQGNSWRKVIELDRHGCEMSQ